MRTVFVFSLILLFNISNAKSQWQYYYEFPELGFINDIKIVSNSIVFVGRYNHLDKSVDFGKNWSVVLNTSEIEAMDFLDIEFLDETHGFVAKRGTYDTGSCLYTENGGVTWDEIFPGFGDYPPTTNNICIAAPGHIYLTAGEGVYDGKVFYTHDNFVHLESVRPAPFNFDQQVADIDCINVDTCIAIHGTPYCCDGGTEKGMYKTVNGGEDWELKRQFFDGIDIEFTSSNVLYAFNFEYIVKSMDQGETWDSLKKHVPGGYFTTMKFLNDSVGYLAEWMYPENKIYFTQDGGETWIENTIDSMPAGKITAIDCWNVDSCFFGSSRKLYRNFSETVSIIETGSSNVIQFTIRPNPASEILFLQLKNSGNEMEILSYNLVGEIVDLYFVNNQADVSHLPPGIYFTEVITEQGRAVQKWVKM